MTKKENPAHTGLEQSGVSRRQVLVGLLTAIGATSLSANVLAIDKLLNTASAAKLTNAPAAFYRPNELALITSLADLIIPNTDTKGALAVGVPALMDALFSQWANEYSQNAHRESIVAVNLYLDKSSQSSYLTLPKQQQIQRLQSLDDMAFSSQSNAAQTQHLRAYKDIKHLIARFYYASEEGAKNELRYEAIPGRWDGCIDFEKVGRTWAT